MLLQHSNSHYPRTIAPMSLLGGRSRRSTRRRILIIVVLFVLAIFFYDTQFRLPHEHVYGEIVSKRFTELEGRMRRSRRALTTDPRGWPGWKNIREIYAFGDSHTYTGFHVRGQQPSLDNPIGNPQWPGLTMNHGPNFVGHLTGTFNQSFIKTYNLAGKGSPFLPSSDKSISFSLYQQIEKKFYAKYGRSDKFVAESKGNGLWTQAESLFVIYLGVDDILFSFRKRGGGRNDTQVEVHIDEYERSIERLYEYGARNFLLINYPELEKSPYMRGSDIPRNFLDIGAEVVQYNGRLAFVAHRVAERHKDINVFYFDNHHTSLAVRDTPTAFPETEHLEHLEGYCFPYKDDHLGDTPTEQVFNELCGVPLDGWFWKDEMHHTEPYHKLIARLMVELMEDTSTRLPYEFY